MKALWRILGNLKPYRWQVILAIAAIAGTVVADLAIPRLTERAIDQGIQLGNINVVVTSALLMLAVAVVSALLGVGNMVFAARASQGFGYDLRQKLFTRILSLSYSNLDKLQTGQLMTRVTSDVDMVRVFVSMSMRMLSRAPLMIIGSLIMIYLTDPRLAGLMLVIMPAMPAILVIFAVKLRPMFKLIQEKLGALNTVLQENLAGVRVVKAFVRADYERKRFRERNEDYYQRIVNVALLTSLAFPLLFLMINLATLAVLWFGGQQVIAGTVSVGQLVAFNNYVLTTMFPLMFLSFMIAMLSGAGASAERICEVLDMQPAVQQKPLTRALPQMRGRVEFDHVSFCYNGGGCDYVLHDITFVAEPGERVALLGATGAGKTTLVNLIPRFYDVQQGRITVDGVDVRDLSLADLRRRIGIVSQQPVLFQGTIRENIAFGRPDATDEEIIAAAKAAQAHDFIMQMPDGYNSYVEARGANLSGGQRQRLAIARALAMNPAILILDDSTSSVDLETEYKIQLALEQLMQGRTSFIIAQRISSVLLADKIIVLDKGEVAAIGTHRRLLETSSIYREIYEAQLKGDVAVDQLAA